MNEQQLLEQIGGLPRERLPERDLWPSIQQRIAPQAAGGLFSRPWFNAVAAVLIMGLSLTIGMQLGPVEVGSPAGEIESAAPTPEQTREGQYYAGLLDLEYSGAMRDVAGQFRAAPEIVPERDNVAMTASLKILQDATEDLRAALEKNPDSIFIADLLATTHRKRMDLLRNLALARVDTSKDSLWRT